MSLGHSEGKHKSNSVLLLEIGPGPAVRTELVPEEIPINVERKLEKSVRRGKPGNFR